MEPDLLGRGRRVQVVEEVAVHQNHMLEYGGYTPSQALLGHNPRGLYETETSSVLAHAGAAESPADFFEHYLRMRMIPKVSIQQAVMEQRLAIADSSRPQKVDLQQFVPMQMPTCNPHSTPKCVICMLKVQPTLLFP